MDGWTNGKQDRLRYKRGLMERVEKLYQNRLNRGRMTK